MDTKDLYKVLGVEKSASQDDIRRAYRKLARKYHPDANPEDPDAETRFKEVQQAYEILSNPEKRREYDRGPREYFGGGAGQGGRQPGGGAGGAGEASFSDLSDLFGGFGDIFGGRSGTQQQRRSASTKGDDVTVTVNLRFKDAFQGITTRVNAPAEESCGDCRGTGAAPGTAPRTCPDCGGSGMKNRDQGFFALSGTCSRCGGKGTVVEKPCPACSGRGRVRRVRQVTVKIPAGARDGMKIRVPGRGGSGTRGGPAGDLYVVTRVEEHPVFKRQGDDFVAEVPVSFVEAALGSEIAVPRPEGGTVKLRLAAGTQDGKQMRVRGAGAPRAKARGERGDLMVKIRLVVPEKLTKREKEILEALADERDEDVRERLFREAREAGA
ncbi:molecular chaperone DnaJ [Rubrobacter aplysinae]|uniref:molecular chaperone DnaJ n=1 Tax=Rubrobacter aplysinae TaxID=909625 RepID=UPI00064BBA26|nr:molecular chaperone DnaJ [Rubrobacter aplysinae]